MTAFYDPESAERPVLAAFPVPIYMGRITDDPAFNRMLAEYIEALRVADTEGIEICRREYNVGYTSYYTKQELFRDPQLADLVQQILRHGRCFARRMGFQVDDPPLEFRAMFANINYRNSFHELHRHRSSFISGSYYVVADKESARISFLDPKFGLRMHEPAGDLGQTPFNSLELAMQPKAGATIMFPSYLEHKVEIQRSDEPRMGFSFNLDYAPARGSGAR